MAPPQFIFMQQDPAVLIMSDRSANNSCSDNKGDEMPSMLVADDADGLAMKWPDEVAGERMEVRCSAPVRSVAE